LGGGEREITRLRLRVAGERGGDLSLTTHRTHSSRTVPRGGCKHIDLDMHDYAASVTVSGLDLLVGPLPLVVTLQHLLREGDEAAKLPEALPPPRLRAAGGGEESVASVQ